MSEKRSENYFETEAVEAPEVERRRMVDSTNELATLLFKYHRDRFMEIPTEPCTDQPKRMQAEPRIGRSGWAFD